MTFDKLPHERSLEETVAMIADRPGMYVRTMAEFLAYLQGFVEGRNTDERRTLDEYGAWLAERERRSGRRTFPHNLTWRGVVEELAPDDVREGVAWFRENFQEFLRSRSALFP